MPHLTCALQSAEGHLREIFGLAHRSNFGVLLSFERSVSVVQDSGLLFWIMAHSQISKFVFLRWRRRFSSICPLLTCLFLKQFLTSSRASTLQAPSKISSSQRPETTVYFSSMRNRNTRPNSSHVLLKLLRTHKVSNNKTPIAHRLL